MAILLPPFILLASMAGILIDRTSHRTNGRHWIIATVGCLLVMVALLYLRINLPSQLQLIKWETQSFQQSSPLLIVDYASWTYLFSFCALIIAIIVSVPGSLQKSSQPFVLIEILGIGALTLVSLMAANLSAVIFCWTALDLLDALILYTNDKDSTNTWKITSGLGGRIFGSFLVLIVSISSTAFSTNGEPIIGQRPELLPLFLIGILLRLNLYPLHIKINWLREERRSLGNILRFALPASALVQLARISSFQGQIPNLLWINLIVILISLVSAVRWLFVREELNGRPYWILTVSCLAILSVLGGDPSGSVVFGAVLIFVGGMLFLHPTINTTLTLVYLAGFVSLSGLPFTPAASGWQAVFTRPVWFVVVFCPLLFAFMAIGFFRTIQTKTPPPESEEKISVLLQPLSLIILLTAHWGLTIFGLPGAFRAGFWLLMVPLSICIVTGLFLERKYFLLTRSIDEVKRRLLIYQERFGKEDFSKLINRDWFEWWAKSIYKIIGTFVNQSSFILEGESGFLWAVLILILLFTFFQKGFVN